MVWPAIIAAGAAIGSQILANRAGSKEAAAGREFDAALQREFAQNGVSWRVADAKRAGIHPLYALGAQVSSASPVAAFQNSGFSGSGFAEAGQHIGRAVQAGLSDKDRIGAKLETLQLERGELENELLRSQIAREKAQLGPPMPLASGPGLFGSTGAGNTIIPVTEVPLERVTPQPGMPWQESGSISELGFSRTPTGLVPVPSKDVKDRIEDNFIQELGWSFRNNLLPNLDSASPPPKSWLPPWANRWEWSKLKQEWQPKDWSGVTVPINRERR